MSDDNGKNGQAGQVGQVGQVGAEMAENAEVIPPLASAELKAIVEAHLEQIAKVNPKLNAVVQLTADSARKEADEADAALARGEIKGPLHGVPMTIKDTLETSGVICTGGTKGRAGYVPKADATAVARLRAAGEDESAQRRKLGLEPVDQLLEAQDVAVIDHGLGHARGELVGGVGELGAQRKEVALQRDELGIERGIEL